MRQVREKSKPPKPHISKTERQALKLLQDENSLIILPADKGNATLVMDRVEYSNKLVDLNGNSGSCKVKKDPTLKTERKLSQILGKNKDLIPQTKYIQLIQHYSKLLAMGSPLSPVLANIYMEYFEEMALGSTSLKPSMWLRYVDDTFIL